MLARVEGKLNVPSRAPRPSQLGRSRVIVEDLQPCVDCGAFSAKRVVGEELVVQALVFSDGHDQVSADALLWQDEQDEPIVVPMKPGPNDVWTASFALTAPGFYEFAVSGWIDRWATWSKALHKR